MGSPGQRNVGKSTALTTIHVAADFLWTARELDVPQFAFEWTRYVMFAIVFLVCLFFFRLGSPNRFPSCVVPAANIPRPPPATHLRDVFTNASRSQQTLQRNIRRAREYKWRRPEPRANRWLAAPAGSRANYDRRTRAGGGAHGNSRTRVALVTASRVRVSVPELPWRIIIPFQTYEPLHRSSISA